MRVYFFFVHSFEYGKWLLMVCEFNKFRFHSQTISFFFSNVFWFPRRTTKSQWTEMSCKVNVLLKMCVIFWLYTSSTLAMHICAKHTRWCVFCAVQKCAFVCSIRLMSMIPFHWSARLSFSLSFTSSTHHHAKLFARAPSTRLVDSCCGVWRSIHIYIFN